MRRTVITITCFCLLACLLSGAGCTGRYRGPRSLAALGTTLVAGGGTAWVLGERSEGNNSLTNAGFVLLTAGLAAVIAAGGWMAWAVSCDADPDCDDSEQCREVPAPPDDIPYKQCVPR